MDGEQVSWWGREGFVLRERRNASCKFNYRYIRTIDGIVAREFVKIVDMEILWDKREKGRKGKVVLSEKNCQQHQRDSWKNGKKHARSFHVVFLWGKRFE